MDFIREINLYVLHSDRLIYIKKKNENNLTNYYAYIAENIYINYQKRKFLYEG